MLLGGPGVFHIKDRAHDQAWSNYFVPLQLSILGDYHKRARDERLTLAVFEPAYERRYLEDSIVTAAEAKQDDGSYLHSIRKKAADKVGPSGYAGYIKRFATQNKIGFVALKRPGDFWDTIRAMPTGSISRVWYVGHSSATALFLSLGHDANGVAVSVSGETIEESDIAANGGLKVKFDSSTVEHSMFLSCYSKGFAASWKATFGVPSEGADGKIDFSYIDRPSPIKNVIVRLQKTANNWVVYN